ASLSLVVAGALGPSLGWRNCFFLLGAIGLFCSLLVLLVKDPGHVQHAGIEKKPLDFGKFFASLGEIPGILLRSPPLLVTMIGGCLLNFSVGTTYLDMLWIKAGGKFPEDKARWIMGIVFLFGGTLGNVLGGYIGDWIQNHLGRHRLWSVMGSLIVCTPMMLMFRWSDPNGLWFWVGYFFVSFMVTMYYGPVFSTVQELSPAHQRSMIMAVFLIGMNLLGVSLGAMVGAILIKVFKDFTLALVVTGLVNLGAIPCFLYAIHLRKVELAKASP
ncbi:MAG: MFS transporter, partial [Planctomycetales bacterium]